MAEALGGGVKLGRQSQASGSRLTSLLCCPLQVSVCHGGYVWRGFQGFQALHAASGLHGQRGVYPIPMQEKIAFEVSAVMPDFAPLPGGCSRGLKHQNPFGGSFQRFFAVFVKISRRQISGQSALNRSGRRVPGYLSALPQDPPSIRVQNVSNIIYISEGHGGLGQPQILMQ